MLCMEPIPLCSPRSPSPPPLQLPPSPSPPTPRAGDTADAASHPHPDVELTPANIQLATDVLKALLASGGIEEPHARPLRKALAPVVEAKAQRVSGARTHTPVCVCMCVSACLPASLHANSLPPQLQADITASMSKKKRDCKRTRDELDRAVAERTGLRGGRKAAVARLTEQQPSLAEFAHVVAHHGAVVDGPTAPPLDKDAAHYERPHRCYVCKAMYTDVHWFYDQLCRPCGDTNFAKRTQTADLTGYVAVVTGGRIKIGACVPHPRGLQPRGGLLCVTVHWRACVQATE